MYYATTRGANKDVYINAVHEQSYSHGRSSLEHRYMLASASPSASNKSSDMFCPVQFMLLTQA